MSSKINILTLNKDELEAFIQEHGFPKYRAGQIWDWLWKKNCSSFKALVNIPKTIIELLETHFTLQKLSIHTKQISKDGSIKYIFKTIDNHYIEGVLIPSRDRITACVSSQIGCSLTCSFCATGKLKLERNLRVNEIFDQVAIIKEEALNTYHLPLSNIVYMGMGEPLLNIKNTLDSIHIIHSAFNFSQKRITVSTAGIEKIIKQLGDKEVKFNLALSLHAANDEKRSEIMPINESNTISKLREALVHFHQKTKRRITIEYIMLDGFNDTLEDAKELAKFTKAVPCKINIIEYNPIKDSTFKRSDKQATQIFSDFLKTKCNLPVTIRRSKGRDINAACGQLASKNLALA